MSLIYQQKQSKRGIRYKGSAELYADIYGYLIAQTVAPQDIVYILQNFEERGINAIRIRVMGGERLRCLC